MIRKNKGFTLVELFIVMVIIAIIAMIAIPKVLEYSKSKKPLIEQIKPNNKIEKLNIK